MVNVELLDKVLDHIEKHPEEHDQGDWGLKTACGTTACFAGHTLLMTGNAEWVEGFGDDDAPTYWLRTAGKYDGWDWTVAGAEELDLRFDDAWTLFHNATNLTEVRAVVKALRDGKNGLKALDKVRGY